MPDKHIEMMKIKDKNDIEQQDKEPKKGLQSDDEDVEEIDEKQCNEDINKPGNEKEEEEESKKVKKKSKRTKHLEALMRQKQQQLDIERCKIALMGVMNVLNNLKVDSLLEESLTTQQKASKTYYQKNKEAIKTRVKAYYENKKKVKKMPAENDDEK